MTTYIAQFISNTHTFGTFKTRFYQYAVESGAIQVSRLGYRSTNDEILLNNKVLTEDDLLLVMNNSDMGNLKFLLNNSLVKVVNPPYHLNKLDVFEVAKRLEISTPNYAYGAALPGHGVVKPIRGEGGTGIRLCESQNQIPGPDFFVQEFIGLPKELGCVFDLRVYTFLNHFLGSTIRITKHTQEVAGKLFGVTNTHQNGTMIYFENHLLPRCPDSEYREALDKIRTWLGFREATQDMKEAASKLSKALNLNYCAVDFIFDSNAKWYVIDINPNAMHGYRTYADRLRMKRAWDIAKGE